MLYEDKVVTSLAERTDDKVTSIFNVLERTVNPHRLGDVNETTLSRYQAELRRMGHQRRRSNFGRVLTSVQAGPGSRP